jgi:hypothetical protein
VLYNLQFFFESSFIYAVSLKVATGAIARLYSQFLITRCILSAQRAETYQPRAKPWVAGVFSRSPVRAIHIVTPLQGFGFSVIWTQGFALGWYVYAFQAKRQNADFLCKPQRGDSESLFVISLSPLRG